MAAKIPKVNSIFNEEINLPFLDKARYHRIEHNLVRAIKKVRKSADSQPQGRKIKIRAGWREIIRDPIGRTSKEFPEILIRGVWLGHHGFEERRYIQIYAFRKVLVICQEDNETPVVSINKNS